MTVPADTAVARVRQDDLVPGYRLVQLVGKGGMGEVHQAVQLSLGRTVAVKLLRAELARDDQFVARFEKEGAALATLRHPNVVSIVDRGKAADTYYLVMEFVDGPSLRERMGDPSFDTMAALRALTQVARAIDYAHNRGVIHRDLKPDNILFDEQAGGLPKVTDFGLAGFDERAGGHAGQNLTQTNVAMGTASYMAPEQRVDAKTAGPRADQYALGVMLYEVLTGELPMGTFDPPSVKKPGLDKRLDAIVARCLKPAPEDRYPSMAAFLVDLEEVVPMTVAPAPSKETRAGRLWRLARQKALQAGRVVAGVTVGFAALIVATVFIRGRVESTKRPAAVELLRDDGAQFPTSTPGRLDKATRTLTLGEGPDSITVMARGRQAVLESEGVRFGPSDEAAGHAVVDASVEGDGLSVSALVDTQATEASSFEPLFALFRGPRAEARSALMLLGSGGRSVMLILSGAGGQPVLEWNLGPDKQGQMRAPLPTRTTAQAVTLRIDAATGELFAIIGDGRDARLLGDGLFLGPAWKTETGLGEAPRVAVGCLDGTCAFRRLTVRGQVVTTAATPPPPPPLEVDVSEALRQSVSARQAGGKSALSKGPVVMATRPPQKVQTGPAPKKPASSSRKR